jgi:tRNA (guanine10-N2)-methyltransferase
MADLLNVAAATLKMGGKLVYIIPSMTDFVDAVDLPRHDCLRLDCACYQPLQMEYRRRIVTMTKVAEYDEKRRKHYLEGTWVNGAESAEKVANIRERLIEAARVKPGYEEKALQRKAKRRSTKEAKKTTVV